MRIQVLASYTHMDRREAEGKTVAVIDTLRSMSTIITALASGCNQVIPVEEIEQAMELKTTMSQNSPILGGERNIMPLPGFDLGNSPMEYTEDMVKGRTLILTTTNGTRAIHAAKDAHKIFIAGMINGGSVASGILRQGRDAVLLCAGTGGYFTLEDVLTAGYIIYRALHFNSNQEMELDDLGRVALRLYESAKDNLLDALEDSDYTRSLIRAGYAKDIEYCLKRDIAKVLPVCRDGQITA